MIHFAAFTMGTGNSIVHANDNQFYVVTVPQVEVYNTLHMAKALHSASKEEEVVVDVDFTQIEQVRKRITISHGVYYNKKMHIFLEQISYNVFS